MVATTSSHPTLYHYTGPFTEPLVSLSLPPPPRQSSLRSITSTHSRRSVQKSDPAVAASAKERRVRFACTDDLDLSGRDDNEHDDVGIIAETVIEFETIAPIEALSLTPQEILDIRALARRQAAQFAADHADYMEEVCDVLEHGQDVDDIGAHFDTLRRRRRRRNTFKVSTAWLEAEPEENDDNDDFSFDDEDDEQDNAEPALYCEDDVVDGDYYGTMRGLETRITPLFRMRRKWAIHSVLQLQHEMKQASCCATQVEMGLRATAVQVSKKARIFAYHQALLDEMELVAASAPSSTST